MDLLGGYGSDSGSDREEEPRQNVEAPKFSTLATKVNAAPIAEEEETIQPDTDSLQEGPESDDETPKAKLVVPASLIQSMQDAEPDIGPARPATTVTIDEKEVPSIENPEVWSVLPAPKAPVRRKVQLLLPINKKLLEKAAEADKDDDVPRKKKAKTGSGKSALLDFLPAPQNDLPKARGGGTLLDLGSLDDHDVKPSTSKSKTSASSVSTQPVMASNEMFRVPQPRASLPKKKYDAFDSDDEDPMASLGPMPEAGAYASGPIADEGEEIPAGAQAHDMQQDLGQDDGQQYGPSAVPGPSTVQYEDDGTAHQHAQYAYGTEGGASGYEYGQYGAEQYYQHDAAQYQQQQEVDAGQAMFQQALAAEKERASKRGQEFDMSGIQFKEVNAADLKYMDPGTREAAQAVRAALGSEYAAALRSEAKQFEGDRNAKRKHQIGTLFYNAKMRELEILEGKASSMKHRAEAQKKYGW